MLTSPKTWRKNTPVVCKIDQACGLYSTINTYFNPVLSSFPYAVFIEIGSGKNSQERFSRDWKYMETYRNSEKVDLCLTPECTFKKSSTYKESNTLARITMKSHNAGLTL